MRLIIPATILSAALKPLASLPPAKPVNPALSNVHLDFTDGYLTLMATDGSYRAKRVVCAPDNIGEDGETLVPAKLLYDIVSKLSGDVTLETGPRLLLKCGRFKSELPCMDVSQFPAWPDGDGEPAFTIQSSVFRAALLDAQGFAPRVDSTGAASWQHSVMLLASAPFLDVAGGTRKRIAWHRLEGVEVAVDRSYLVPAEYAKRLADSLPDDDSVVTATILGGSLQFKWGTLQAVTPLYDLAPPKIQELLLSPTATRIRMDGKELARILGSFAPLFAADSYNPGVDFTGTGPLRLATVDAEVGQAEDELALLGGLGEPLDLRLALRDLTAALGVVGDGAEVELCVEGKRPVVLADPRKPGVVVCMGRVEK